MNLKKLLKSDLFYIVLFSAVYLLLALKDFYGPGILFEELDSAINAWQLAIGHEVTSRFQVLGLPVMQNIYFGALPMYIMLIFYGLFGIGITAIRAMGLTFGVIIIIFTYKFASKFFNRAVAILTVILLVTHPVFILFTRASTFADTILNVFLVLCLYSGGLYIKSRKPGYLYLFALLAGMGLWQKIVFIWFIAAVVFLALIYRKRIVMSWKRFLLCGLFFIAGTSPILYYNARSGWPTLRLMTDSLMHGTDWDSSSIDNMDLISNIKERFRQFDGLFEKRAFDSFTLYKNSFFRSNYTELFIFAFLFLFVRSVTDHKHSKKILSILTVFTVIMLGLSFTVSVFRQKHMFLLVPLQQIILSLFIYFSYVKFKQLLPDKPVSQFIYYGIPTVFFILLMKTQLINLAYTYSPCNPPVNVYATPAIYELVDYLEKERIMNPLIFNKTEYIRNNIYFLSRGRIDPVQIREYPGFVEKHKEFYLLRFPEFIHHDDKGNLSILEKDLAGRKYDRRTQKVFKDQAARPVYILEKYEMKN